MKMYHEDSESKKLKILEIDPWLVPHKKDLELRVERYEKVKKTLLGEGESFSDFSNGHHYFGFHPTGRGWVYREWAPGADALFLMGDFNGWNRESHPLTKKAAGVWEINLQGTQTLAHASFVKVHVVTRGVGRDRIPLYIRRVVQDSVGHDFRGQIWMPEKPYEWKHSHFRIDPNDPPLIYECHVGMAQEKEGLGTYVEFRDHILPRIKELGYNTVQIMAVMQHPYYASFGYHVSSYFAASSWFGTPEELKSLVDRAHELGLAVLMDLVHSHAVKNTAEGINAFDGTTEQFFHPGEKGEHSAWDSKLFNYGKHEVIHFLLSSIKYWMEEYQFDGFRFDGVTSMLYHDHGLGTAFDRYDKYFSLNTDVEAVTYLQFAARLVKEIRADACLVAEDMSGMPGMCLPIEKGGIGFDYRLAMGMPDFWVKTLEKRDEDWHMPTLVHELSTGRPGEKRIAYVESHDQALVGDKTMIFRMADAAMYHHMDKNSQNLVVERATALHKMVRLITISLGAEGYLNFMGNEFGHPEWIDFPREGNGWSYRYCRRQWSLADNPSLRYHDLNQFDRAMVHLAKEHQLMGGEGIEMLQIDQENKIIAFRKNDHLYAFNFHPQASCQSLQLSVGPNESFRTVLDTDEARFGGQGRISHAVTHHGMQRQSNPKDTVIGIYLPSRTAAVFQRA